MLIRTLTLENFGLYSGLHTIDLAPQVKYGRTRPVVLIGGKNGAGKTTLLEALRLCLYGPLSLGTRVSTREYDAYLRGRIHRADGILIQSTSAAVGLEFEYAKGGTVQVYSVQRRWETTEAGVRSSLSVLEDGKELQGLDRTHADEFLRDLIPQGVSQLYFFDGEKIQQLAESDNDNETLAAAIRELLGLDLVDTLRGDLRVYLGRLDDRKNTEPLQRELIAIIDEKTGIHSQLIDAVRHRDECQSALDSLRQEVAREENRLSRKGGVFASQREALKAERHQLQVSLQEAENDLRELCEGLLPFVLARQLCEQLGNQLDSEAKVIAWDAVRNLLASRIQAVKETTLPQLLRSELHVNLRENAGAVDKITTLLDSLIQAPDDLPSVALVHRLSIDQSQKLLNAIDRIRSDVPQLIKASNDRLEHLTRRIRETEQAEGQVPEQDELAVMLERLGELNRQLPGAAAAAARAQDEVDRLERRLVELGRAETKVQERMTAAEGQSERQQLVGKVQKVLADYSSALTASKTRQLSDAIRRRFGELWRKGDAIARIEVEPLTFEISLFDELDRRLPKSELSAGEKQMFAISLLWALADISGRPLPMVIDTPLGRLDSDHRRHLVERYFPNASHQVIVLSTDTEIDRTYFQVLAGSLSHSYHIDYDQDDARSTFREGYFWKRREEDLIGAS